MDRIIGASRLWREGSSDLSRQNICLEKQLPRTLRAGSQCLAGYPTPPVTLVVTFQSACCAAGLSR